MSQFLARLKALGQKAEQVRLAIDAAPARAAQIRESVQATAGRLRELRGEVEGTLTDLKAGNDESFASKIAELDGADDVFLRAGFRLASIDLEQGASQRLLVRLDATRGPVESPERLVAACGDRRTVLAILAALEQARNTADDVFLRGHSFQGVTVQLGAAPAVRLHWLPDSTPSPAVPPPLPAGTGTASTKPVPATSPIPPGDASTFASYGSGSFFERRTDSVPDGRTPEPATKPVDSDSTTPAQPATPKPAAAPDDWRKDALARFKKMPDLR